MSSKIASTPTRSSPIATPLTVLDLFAGAGGMTEGFHAAGGYRSVEAVELDRDAAASYAATFPDVEVHVSAVHEWLEQGTVPSVDVVIGGPPCQGFSPLGKRDVLDARNLLWNDYAKVIVRAQPAFFVLENVGAFMRSTQFQDLTAATEPGGVLAEYRFDAAVLNAADYGAPQARKRTILIGHHRDLPAPGMPAPTRVGRHRTVRTALRGVGPIVTTIDLPHRWTAVGDELRAGAFMTTELHVGRRYEPVTMARIKCIPQNGNRFDLPPHLLPNCWKNHYSGSADVMGRLNWDRPSVTIRTEFWKPEKGRYLHPDEDRAITHYEAALLQGFDRNRKWVGTKASIGRQIGNAVPIALGKAIAAHLAAATTA
ncbi:DNA cytosine methyltransferase [Nakamurella leprariae]|uniref:Cytosine-specific methyltransferase n=1 Tax=Nakamurella leprariae TaxID=2803911 RepID=A0A938YGP2_9ACTN|nr:DNA cytosine methyltransferase [Nakamurella leprariae]MBM9467493.1 DNA cytosine methyltransferase [Nakamurella leprariae]